MNRPKLWITFHRLTVGFDSWALYLDSEDQFDCDIWQVSGQPLEFKAAHVKGGRPETKPDFTEKWLLRDKLTTSETDLLRRVAGEQLVDNEAEFWDSRIYCFEILAELEKARVLEGDTEEYANVRVRLHEKWTRERLASKDIIDDLATNCERQQAMLSAGVAGPPTSPDARVKEEPEATEEENGGASIWRRGGNMTSLPVRQAGSRTDSK